MIKVKIINEKKTGLFSFTHALCILKPARWLENNGRPVNRGLAISLRIFSFFITADDFGVNTLPHVLYRFPKYADVHEFVKAIFKLVLFLLSDYVFMWMCDAIQHSFSNSNTLWTFFNFIPWLR